MYTQCYVVRVCIGCVCVLCMGRCRVDVSVRFDRKIQFSFCHIFGDVDYKPCDNLRRIIKICRQRASYVHTQTAHNTDTHTYKFSLNQICDLTAINIYNII